jgi:hypothetical protein
VVRQRLLPGTNSILNVYTYEVHKVQVSEHKTMDTPKIVNILILYVSTQVIFRRMPRILKEGLDGGGEVWKSVNSNNFGVLTIAISKILLISNILTVNLWKVFWNQGWYRFAE